MKGKKALRTFDAKNISGRAGRFMTHYSGRVFMIDPKFQEILNDEDDPIRHKNYEIGHGKHDIDLIYTSSEFLTDEDKRKDKEAKETIKKLELPDYIVSPFKVISRKEKASIYTLIASLSDEKHSSLRNCILLTNYPAPSLDLDGFQVFLDIVRPIISEVKIQRLIDNRWKRKQTGIEYSVIFPILNSYLSGGMNKLFKYNTKERVPQMTVDNAIRDAADNVYNVFKYSLVKYLGVFNLMYKYYIHKTQGKPFDEVVGFDKLLSKLEYNAFSKNAKIASDYGATNNIINYFEDGISDSDKKDLENSFDGYEQALFKKIKYILD